MSLEPFARADGVSALHVGWCTHRGNFRKNNEDVVIATQLDGQASPPAVENGDAGGGPFTLGPCGILVAVCDGVGGGAAGEVASGQTARSVEAKLRGWDSSQAKPGDGRAAAWLVAAVQGAHQDLLNMVQRDRGLEGMGSTLTAAWFLDGWMHLAQVGDSRLYRRRGGRIEQLSNDQSFVGELRRSGAITDEQARRHPLRNLIDQVVGGSEDGVKPEISRFQIRAGDEFLLCSDGLTDSLTDGSILRLLVERARDPLVEVARQLLQLGLDAAGRDNTTVALVRIGGERHSFVTNLVAKAQLAWNRRSATQTPMAGSLRSAGSEATDPESDAAASVGPKPRS